MFAKGLKLAFNLSIIIAILMVVASLGRLFIEDIYLDNLLVRAGWLGNDLVTLCVAVPLLITSMVLAKNGSSLALLVWLGMVLYTLYNYAFYLFVAAFNSLFLVYAALFTLSIFVCFIKKYEKHKNIWAEDTL